MSRPEEDYYAYFDEIDPYALTDYEREDNYGPAEPWWERFRGEDESYDPKDEVER